MERNLGKKINVNAASLVDLKAELFKRKEQFKRERAGQSSTFSSKPVSEKTASIWLKQKPSSKVTKSKPDTNYTKATPLTEAEEKQLARSRAALEAKAALYEKLTKKENLPEEEEDNPYLVDFQQKYIDKALRHREADTATTAEETQEKTSVENDDWVEYTDSFGRSRKCLRKDLPELEKNDNQLMSKRERSPVLDLMSEDMKREIERQRWEEDAYEELSEEIGPVHYQDVQHNEIRSHGVAYYQFATDEEKRQEQLAALNKLRDQTIEQRQKREKLKEKRKSIAEARLRKIKARKLGLTEEEVAVMEEAGKELPQEVKEEEDVNKEEKEVAAKLEEMEATMKRVKHLRPWDRGKIVDPIKKRKKELQDERLPEFAPPASYYKSEKSSSSKQTANSTASFTTVHDDPVYNPVNPESSNTVTASSFQLPPLFSHPTPASNDYITETIGDIRRNPKVLSTNSTEDKINSMNSSVQKPNDNIRESVTEVLRYYKSKYAVNE